MTRFSLFDSPFLLGFDQFERSLDRVTKAANDGYPPYNIEQLEDGGLRITLAVAGFDIHELSATIEGNELIIEGEQRGSDTARAFHHQGIATRKFQRRFVLAEGIEVTDASCDNGLLHIDLVRPTIENSTRRISIRDNRTVPARTTNAQTAKAAAE